METGKLLTGTGNMISSSILTSEIVAFDGNSTFGSLTATKQHNISIVYSLFIIRINRPLIETYELLVLQS